MKPISYPEKIKSQRDLNNLIRADFRAVDIELVKWALEFQRVCASYGVPLIILEAKRSKERQRELFAKGVSKIPEDGPHVRGMAIDIVHAVEFWKLDLGLWGTLAEIGFDLAAARGLKLTWGGQWGWDYAHWELKDWRDRPALLTNQQVTDAHLERIGLLTF